MKRFLPPALLLAILVLVPLQASAQGWRYTEYRDPMTDDDESFITGFSTSGDELAVGVKCISSVPRITLVHDWMGGDLGQRVLVEMRFDREKALSPKRWPLYASREISVAPVGDQPLIMMKLQSADRLLIRVTDPVNGRSRMAEFSLSGFTAAYNRLSCSKNYGW